MVSKLINKIIEKVPVSQEIKNVIEENVDLTSSVANAVVSQMALSGSKLKQEIGAVVKEELQERLSSIDVKTLLQDVLEDMEMDITVSFKSKDKD
ncbi:hypothetical protein KAH37_02610 [bacterium]|nr:hypothetical protein [bacterium]